MTAQSLGAAYRSTSDRILRKTLAIGLGGSILLHTAAIAGASYFYQGNIEDLMITEIERVKVDPEPVVKPVAPIAKPMPIPELKVFKPKTIAAPPIPILPDVPKLKPIDIPPAEVVKITKAAPTQPQTSPRVKPASPAPKAIKTATVIPPKSTLPLSFPNKLFTDPQPKPARAEIAAQTPPKQDPQPTNNQAALAPPTNRSPKLAPVPAPEREDNSDPDRELAASSPGRTSKVARTPDRSPDNNNQTSLNPQPQSPPNFGGGFGSLDSNPSPSTDDFAGTPSNNTRIARNIATTAPATTNNQVGLGNSPQRGNSADDLGGGTPGNIATGSRNKATIQCLRNCEIRYPDELENIDIGRDKILVKVTIDPNGLVASAEIARSSGNQKLDQFTLEGVKQMQLNPTGKTRTHRIKISTLINN